MSKVAKAIGVAAVLLGAAFFAPALGLSGFALNAFRQIAVGVALSKLGQALQKKPSTNQQRGTRISVGLGEDVPQSFIVGDYVTAGDLTYAGSHGQDGKNPNAYFTQVIELSDNPQQVERVWVNGEWVTLGTQAHPDYGLPVTQYRNSKGKDHLWIKLYDGTQTAADPMLVNRYPQVERQYTAQMIGRGVPYAIVTSLVEPEMHQSVPRCRFQLRPMALYDPREDSTAGGSGPQRWNNRSTWTRSRNPVVIVYNILRGIRDPITTAHMWGGQGVTAADLPSADWFAAMNACDAEVEIEGGGTEPQYRAGLEIFVNEEPADVIERLLLTCQGQISETAGRFQIRVGAPAPPVYSFTDADLVITTPDTFDPFPGLEAAYNGVGARYPELADGGQMRDAPERHSSAYQVEDGGRRQIADLTLDAAPYSTQVQRLQLAALEDGRRFRRHTLVLPPEARRLGPLDTVAWTSDRNGYNAKEFTIDLVEDLPGGNVAVALREVDPDDYDWSSDFELPSEVGFGRRPPRLPIPIIDFSVEPATILDANGIDRRPAIRLNWDPDVEEVVGIRYEVRLFSVPDHIPDKGDLLTQEADAGPGLTLVFNGQPVEFNGAPVTFGFITDVERGSVLISQGLIPNTAYEVRARYVRLTRSDPWSDWLDVITPNILIAEEDLAQIIRDRIDNAFQEAQEARQDALEAKTKAEEIEDLVDGLSQEVLDDLRDIADQLAGLETGDIQELRGIAVAGHRRGWAADPTFQNWEGGDLADWTTVGIATNGSRDTSGTYRSALRIDAPAGAFNVNIRASSEDGGLIAADPQAEYVVVSILLRTFSGTLGQGRLRAEWRNTATQNWQSGAAFGVSGSTGVLTSAWGFVVDPGRFQSREIIWRKPAGTHDAVQLFLAAKLSSNGDPIEMRVDYLDMRAASAAEIEAFNAQANAQAKVDALEVTLIGPGGALAALQTTVEANFGTQIAQVQNTITSVATDVDALAGQITTFEAAVGGTNLVRNPQFRLDNQPLGLGVNPLYWGQWTSGMQVVESGSGPAAQTSAPTRYIARISADGQQHQGRAFDSQDVKPGDMIRVMFQHAASPAGGVNFTMQARMHFYGANGSELAGSPVVRSSVVTGTAWVDADFGAPVITVPPGAATARLVIRRNAGGSAHVAYITNVEARFVDGVSLARAEQAFAASATNEQAISTLQTTTEAEIDGLSTSLQVTQSSLAQTQGLLASTYSIRAVAGAGEAGLRIVAYDDATGSGGIVRLLGDQILLEGSVAMQRLVVTDLGNNLVINGALVRGDMRGWESIPPTFFVAPHGSNAAMNNSPTAFALGMGADSVNRQAFISDRLECREGDRFSISFDYAMAGAAAEGTIRLVILFYDQNGNAFDSISNSGVANVSGLNWRSYERVDGVVAPQGTKYARLQIRRVAGGSGNAFVTNLRVVQQSGGATLITPNSLTTREINVASLTATSAWITTANIVDLTVTRNLIVPGATFNQWHTATGPTLTVISSGGLLEVIAPVTASFLPPNITTGYLSAAIQYRPGTSGDWTNIAFDRDDYRRGSTTDGDPNNKVAYVHVGAAAIAVPAGTHQFRRATGTNNPTPGQGDTGPISVSEKVK